MDTKEKTRKTGPQTVRKTNIKVKKSSVHNTIHVENAVVYTPARPFDRRRFLLRMATVVAIVLALLLGMSIFFKVENVTVAGTEKYSQWDVREASGIRDGEHLLTLNKAKIGGKITTKLPYVKSVRIGLELPRTVKIEIEEMEVVYAIADSEGNWWLMGASGKIVEAVSGSEAKSHTKITGLQLKKPEVGAQAVAMEAEPQINEEGESIPVTILESERLDAVIEILQLLEKHGVIGQAKSLDVSDMTMIELWFGERYQVLLGNTEKLDYKVQSMVQAIKQQKDYQRGVLDVSFTTWGDQVNLSPFSE